MSFKQQNGVYNVEMPFENTHTCSYASFRSSQGKFEETEVNAIDFFFGL